MELLVIVAVSAGAYAFHLARRPRCGWCSRPVAMHDRLEDGRVLCRFPRRWALPGR